MFCFFFLFKKYPLKGLQMIWEADICTRLYGVKSLVLKSNAHQRWQDQKPVSNSLGNSLVSCPSVCLSQLCRRLGMLMEKAMAPHSSTLAWKIPWTEEPGGLQSMGLLRVGHSWATSLSLFTSMHWRRKWQPTPVFLPGESQGRGSLVGCRLWGRTESDTTEVT